MVHGPETKPSQNPLVKNVENNNSGEWNLIARCGIWYAGREGNDARVLRGDLSLANITWQLVWLVETGSRRRSRKRKSNKAQVLCHILTLVYQERDIYLDLWKTEFHFNSVLLLGFADWERKRNGRTKRNPNGFGALGDDPLLHCFLFLSPRSRFRWRRRRGNSDTIVVVVMLWWISDSRMFVSFRSSTSRSTRILMDGGLYPTRRITMVIRFSDSSCLILVFLYLPSRVFGLFEHSCC